ncbi:MAG TPA: efflux RND transporter periplasmic adaptor subunit [Steroidobacteraceae bacterium]|nr:efflux RND transporter periplasmic adaptor subunit [Steroidobacteraceae bacterium]
MNVPTRWMSRRRWVLLAAGAFALVLIAWLLSPGRSRTLAAPQAGSPGIAIDVATATRTDVPVYFEGLGTVQAFYTVKITARVDGELQRVAFVEGQTLKRGDLLAQIDPRPFQAALDEAIATQAKDNAQLANAKQDLERYMVLAPQDLASKQTVDTQRALVAQLEAQLKADQAAIENARTQLSYTTITSPINGRTGIRLVDPGNIVHASDTTGIVVMTQLQPIAVIFTLPEASLEELSDAMRAGPVSVAALSQGAGKELDRGTVSLIDNQIDQTTGTIRVKAIFPNPSQRLWPGQFVNARVHLRTVHNAVTIPPAALQRGPNGPFVYVVKSDSTVDMRPVTVSGNTEQTVLVESGLEPGERVAVSNIYRLQPGIRVRVSEAAPARVASSAGPATP